MNAYGWFWYLFGALVTLAWKWQRYCYESKGKGISFGDASKEWFELVTLKSRVSWGATMGVVWALGTVIVDKVGASWLFGGVFMDMPVAPPFLFTAGALSEMTVPSFAKWIYSRIFNGGETE